MFLNRTLSYVKALRAVKHRRPDNGASLRVQAVPNEASRAKKRVGFVLLCREIKIEAPAVLAAGDTSEGGPSRVVLEVLQAAKVAAPKPEGTERNVPRDLAVFDHGDLAEPEKAEALSVVFVRWEGIDGLGGCVAGPRREGRARRLFSAGRQVANGANEDADEGDERVMATNAPRTRAPGKPRTAFAAVLPRREPATGSSRRDKKSATLFGHVPDGATVFVRRMRVPGLQTYPHSLDASVPRETCELRLEARASERGARRTETLVALERLTPLEDASGGDADDGWLGLETRCVFEPAGCVDEPAGDATLESAHANEPVPDPKARTTKVVFHYLYHRGKLRKTESTVGMTCPLCLRDADNFDAMSVHMDACHGRFKFAFFPGGDVQTRRPNIGRPPKEKSAKEPEEGSPGNASDDSAPLVTLVAPKPGPADPAVHVMCREEDENAREQAEQDEWEWFHLHGGWYTGNRSRRKAEASFLEQTDPPKSDASDASPSRADARAASEPVEVETGEPRRGASVDEVLTTTNARAENAHPDATVPREEPKPEANLRLPETTPTRLRVQTRKRARREPLRRDMSRSPRAAAVLFLWAPSRPARRRARRCSPRTR